MKKIALLGVTVLTIFLFTACNYSSASKKEASKHVTNWDETTKTFTSEDGVLKIDGVDETKNYKGKPAIKINFTLTNKKVKPVNVRTLVMSMMKVQQKTINIMNDLKDAKLIDNFENHLRNNLNTNETITGNCSYILDTESDPIQIQFMVYMFSPPVATYDVSL
ncbi:DUF5067 domain-containing protein (plasmid) [Lactococcus lactis subsp. lactis]|uniref:DUF5067 domain-containing protein n=1 Tax=Lactococcus lactis TaxID=1358 RepID=UPI002647E052|nr:DUF5067 domain-containing protein [Lactococcus lactis]WKB49900.1 DUF5067 domain-containing protein [Lactococcus lactis subsp. lactis]